MAPSLISLALDVLKTSPSITLDPATLPALETLNISNISTDPDTCSLISGYNNPDILFFIKFKTS